MINRLLKILPLLIGLTFSSLTYAVSFDCKKASTASEYAICNNQILSNLDDQLAMAYRNARSAASNPDQLKNEQVAWLGTIRACNGDAVCIEKAYRQRISVLSSNASNQQSSKLTQQLTTQTQAQKSDVHSTDGSSMTIDELSTAVTRLARHIKIAEDWLQTHPNDEVIKVDLKNNLETYQGLNKQLELMERTQKSRQQQLAQQNQNNNRAPSAQELESDKMLGTCIGALRYMVSNNMREKIGDNRLAIIKKNVDRLAKIDKVANECLQQNPSGVMGACLKSRLSARDFVVFDAQNDILEALVKYPKDGLNGMSKDNFLSLSNLGNCEQ